MVYGAAVNDPFYRATIPITLDASDGTNLTSYMPDLYVNVLGCTDQHQFCNPTTANCTNLTAANLISNELRSIGLNDAQNKTAYRLDDFLFSMTTQYNLVRGASALRASETISSVNNIQNALPDNQRITEVSTWFAVSLALLQQKTVQYATGPQYTSDILQLVPPVTKQGKKMCQNQKVGSLGGTTSFSVLWVTIILVCGLFLIVTSFTIDTLVSLIRQRFHWDEYKSLQWTLDEKLQLHRLAYEEAGQGHWSGGASGVPVTEKDERIGLPKPVDRSHPRLSHHHQTCSQQAEQQEVGGGDDASEDEGLMARKETVCEDTMHSDSSHQMCS